MDPVCAVAAHAPSPEEEQRGNQEQCGDINQPAGKGEFLGPNLRGKNGLTTRMNTDFEQEGTEEEKRGLNRESTPMDANGNLQKRKGLNHG